MKTSTFWFAWIALSLAIGLGEFVGSALAEEQPQIVVSANDKKWAAAQRGLWEPVDFDFSKGSWIEDLKKLVLSKTGLPLELEEYMEGELTQGFSIWYGKVRGISLKSLLNLIAYTSRVTWAFQYTRVVLDLDEHVPAYTTQVYPVLDLVCAGTPAGATSDAGYELLEQLLVSSVHPSEWDGVGGPGSVQRVETAGSLVVSQSLEIHWELASLLESLRAVRQQQFPELVSKEQAPPAAIQRAIDERGKPVLPGVRVISQRSGEATKAIFKALEQPIELKIVNQPLHKALAIVQEKTGLNVWLDRTMIEDDRFSETGKFSARASKAPLREILDEMLDAAGLAYMIRDEVLMVSRPGHEIQLSTRIYPVGDLLESIHPESDASVDDGYATLRDVITTSISPTTWDEVGGPGAVIAYAPSAALVISAEGTVHDEIEKLLVALRAARKAQWALRGPPRDPGKPLLSLKIYPIPYRPAEKVAPATGGGFFAVDDAPQQSAAPETVKTTPARVWPTAPELVPVILQEVAPESWQAKKGPGTIMAVTGSLVVRQTGAVHRQLEKFLREFGD